MTAPPRARARRRRQPVRTYARLTLESALLLLMAPAVCAELRPDAGDVARDTAPAQLLGMPAGGTTLPGTAGDQGDGSVPQDATPIPVRHVRVTGARLYPTAVLEALVADLNGGTRTLADLSRGAARITRFYRAQGWPLASAYLPAQSIRDGQVEIRVMEGTLSGVRIQADPQSRLRASVIDAHLAALEHDAPLNQAQVDRALLLLSDLAGASLNASLAAGAHPGQTELVIGSRAAPLTSGRLEADNYGSLYTGRTRVGGTLNVNSPTGHGEQISARVLASDDHLYYGRLSVQMPLGSRGLSTGAGFTHTQYVLGSAFTQLDARGQADIAEWNLTYPFVRSVAHNVFGQFSAEHRRISDQVGASGTETGKRADHYSANLLYSGRDGVGAGADTQAALRIGTGTLGIDSPTAARIDALGAQTAGRYSTLNLDLQRNQRLGGPWGLLLVLRGQAASRNLDSYQKFVLGGANGVRAYPAGEAAGDEGWLASGELYYAANPLCIPSVFYDAGGIGINRHPYLTTANRRVLHGYGIGLRGSHRTFDWSASLAFRGSEPTQTEPDRRTRLWVRLGWAF
ncbi:ShlB/FhaC/HecB family hemolysin secretion/activation protein [Ralstonia nicotianae]|uniref:Activation/secretion signal peptide protein n=1 Tax=Ralstonia solanacearum TaxID=305 RepID=A0A0S4WYU8_RALSL|nr:MULTISPECIES: ShlB/FhaC/HecB family hemolysin secretion/activation protein [Ralstonia]QKL54831.1 ShlB/FhaC/HecB family hemolysin secretion/activation protein [Ralstonia solanacearum]MDO3516189.1 ShlB/FhaC/HecB family hemolysin secretion/activation protein [Ralstonia pseudosolanacearum]MDO3541625.1 ShlB/FhaC/HecB family hemolysin secretion/activation protein [Ralstonia pseudosolanacearum]OAI60033.1 activation/secretion signal peptide protein [Ralstonia pseudosolanacearum]QKM26084.1 ShlB/FhaC